MQSRYNMLSRAACDVLIRVIFGMGCLHSHRVRPRALGGEEEKMEESSQC